MAKTKSPKNKTIDFDVDQGKKYIDRCLVLNDDISLNLEMLINYLQRNKQRYGCNNRTPFWSKMLRGRFVSSAKRFA